MAWLVELTARGEGMKKLGQALSRASAQHLVDTPYRPGLARIFDDATGEEWYRRRGSWFKNASADRRFRNSETAEPAEAIAADGGDVPEPRRYAWQHRKDFA
jgi:hypothetical protein